MTLPHLPRQVVVKKNEDRRLLRGHPWVFSNEIRELRGTPQTGEVVEVLNAGGLTVGVGFYNAHSLIAVRMLSGRVEEIDTAFFRRRLEAALSLRRRLHPNTAALRLVHGESDYLPGLIIDQYGDILAVQTSCFGMDLRLKEICGILDEMVHPRAMIERNDTALRTLEHLPLSKGILQGTPSPVRFLENGIDYEVNVMEGQKTGFFLDQRENRAVVGSIAQGLKVLDCFCNEGGFALNAAHQGAREVLGIDSASDAIQAATNNAARNALSQVRFQCEDVFQALAALAGTQERFDLVVLDPPSFSRNRKTVPAARQGYRDLHIRAFRVMAREALLATASCSHHIDAESFLEDIHTASRKSGRRLQLLQWRGAPADHPVLPGVPETEYLKFGLFRVSQDA